MKKVGFVVGVLICVFGFILTLGTAGASDLGHIPTSHIFPRLVVGTILIYSGVGLIDVTKTRRNKGK